MQQLPEPPQPQPPTPPPPQPPPQPPDREHAVQPPQPPENALHAQARATAWEASKAPPPPSDTNANFDLLDHLNLDYHTFPFGYDNATGKKTPPNQKHASRDRTKTGVYIECSLDTVAAIDIDRPSIEATRVLQLVNGRCNLVAKTRKGIHLLFKNNGLLPQGLQTACGMDIRSQSDGNKPDILFCAPARYVAYGELVRYEWIAIPATNDILPCPSEAAAFIRTLTKASGAASAAQVHRPFPQRLGAKMTLTDANGIPHDKVAEAMRTTMANQKGTMKFMNNRYRHEKTAQFTVRVPGPDYTRIQMHNGDKDDGMWLCIPSSETTYTELKLQEAPVERKALERAMAAADAKQQTDKPQGNKKAAGPRRGAEPRSENDVMEILAKHAAPQLMQQPLRLPALTPIGGSSAAAPTLNDFDAVLFFDGGSNGANAPSGAGVTIFTKSDDWMKRTDRWIYAEKSTNNIMESCALVACLTWADKHEEAKKCLTIGDSQWALKGLTGEYKITDPKHVETFAAGKELMQKLGSRITLAHMYGHANSAAPNPADANTHLAREAEKDLDPEQLFPKPPAVSPTAAPEYTRKARHKHCPRDTARDDTGSLPALTERPVPTSVEEYLERVKGGARRTIPHHMWEHWAHTVKQYTTHAANAPTMEGFAHAIMLLELAPTTHLPKHARLKTISSALQLGRAPLAQPADAPRERTERQRQIRRCETLAREGFYRQAVRALAPCGVADPSDPEILQQLRDKHPARTQTMPEIPPLKETSATSAEHVIERINKCGNGVSPGFSGWTKELMRAAVQTDPTIAGDLAAIEARVQDGGADELTREIITLGKLISLVKDGPTPAEPNKKTDVRPIVVGEFLDNLFGAIAMDLTGKDNPPWQRGLASAAGARESYQAAQQWFVEGAVLLTLDNKNAFNSVWRSAILQALLQRRDSHDRLLKYFRFRYARPTTLVATGRDGNIHKLLSDDGTAQGNHPAGYLYCLPQDDVLQRVAPEDPKAGYMDDVTLRFDRADVALDRFLVIEKAYATIGLTLNRSKCELIAPWSPEVAARCAELGIKLMRSDDPRVAAKILGAPVGHAAAREQWCADRLARTEAMCDILADDEFDPRLAYDLLQHVHLARAKYLAECVEPHITAKAMKKFDATTFKTFQRIFGTDIEQYWMEHPAGAGLLSMERCAPEVYRRANLERAARSRAHAESLHQYTAQQLGLPEDPKEFAQSLSAAGYNGRMWMQFAPHVHVTPHHFITAMRLRCHAPMPRDANFCCCGAKLETHHHLLNCQYNNGYTAVHRHNETLGALAHVARSYGIVTVVEPTCYQYADKTRPDILFCLGQRSVAVDLTVVDPCADSHVAQAQTVGATAAAAASGKNDKHGGNVAALGHKFYSLAVETYGHMDGEVWKAFRHVSTNLREEIRSAFVRDMMLALSISVQSGNAKLYDCALRRARRYAAYWAR